MPVRFGPFDVMYTQREQKIRDTIAHMVAKHGIVKARMLVGAEYEKTASVNPGSESAIYWNDVRWAIKHMTHLLIWGQEKGI